MSADIEELAAVFDGVDVEALMARVDACEATDADRELMARLTPHLDALVQVVMDTMMDIFAPWCLPHFTFGPTGRTYRTTPIEGAQLGGRPRNPEDDVVDAIDELVDWQLKDGEGW